MLIWEAQPEPGGAEACPVAERCGQLRQLRVNAGSFVGCLAGNTMGALLARRLRRVPGCGAAARLWGGRWREVAWGRGKASLGRLGLESGEGPEGGYMGCPDLCRVIGTVPLTLQVSAS